MKFVLLKPQRVFFISFISVFILSAKIAFAEPWYSGPLLSDPSIVTSVGHGYLQWHIFQVNNYGAYSQDFDFFSLPRATTKEIDTTFNYGITPNTEAQAFITYIHNATEGKKAGNLGDTTITLATQLTLQNGKKWPPNIKLMFRQLFPTGRYDQLNGNLYGTDATGQGSYLSSFAANMEHVTHLWGEHYLVEFATISVVLATPVKLQGYSIYGGNAKTQGTMWPGNSISFNLAAEYSPSQHWGYIIETYIYAQQASRFTGHIGEVEPRFNYRPFLNRRERRRIFLNNLRPSFLNLGGDRDIGHGNVAEFTLAPAIDYSFTKDVALTAGFWFTVAGKNTPAFYTPMISFTAHW